MLKKLLGRSASAAPRGEDTPIIHQSVPDEVLYPERKEKPAPDMSFLDTALKTAPAKAAETAPRPAPRPAPPSAARPAAKDSPAPPAVAPAATSRAPNPPAAPRPAFPVGWLAVVEGPQTGDWFVLETGLSSIGVSDGDTIRLKLADGPRSAHLLYDPERAGFFVSGTGMRLNGIAVEGTRQMRDGDVIGLGGCALKLVGLAGQNFNWSK